MSLYLTPTFRQGFRNINKKIIKWLPVTKCGSKSRDIALDAVCCNGTIDCRIRGLNRQSHFAHRFVPSRQNINFHFLIKFNFSYSIH